MGKIIYCKEIQILLVDFSSIADLAAIQFEQSWVRIVQGDCVYLRITSILYSQWVF